MLQNAFRRRAPKQGAFFRFAVARRISGNVFGNRFEIAPRRTNFTLPLS